ncbi:MAG: acetyl-CoA decarbonylase/synthase complex subunit gamma [Candidatus Hydrogenedentes bacterium]|nr:acetyl-CoA decarbonylase/synthase complex subunit gamma [Candidatus Hydrogenedentota bacterium]
MALSGLEIYKHLPKSNCKECGVATCLAFAMKVASGQASLEGCPRLDEKGKTALGEAGAPPQSLISFGANGYGFEIGQETVLYRHEDKFYHPTAISVCINDSLDNAILEQRCKELSAIAFDRMGKTSVVDMLALVNASKDTARFAEAARLAAASFPRSLALLSPDPTALRAAGEAVAARRPLLWALCTGSNPEAFFKVAEDLRLPLCIEAPGFEALAGLADQARVSGLKDLVLSPGPVSSQEGCAFLTQSRRAAITKKFRSLGYPVAMMAMDEDPLRATVDACWYILKYAGIVVANLTRPEHILALAATRQDIYTNPQIPVQVPAGLHEVGDPGPDAPVLVTTNFALSYYSVESEISSARIPAYILAVDTEGTSVLTAWAAEKLTGATTAEALAKARAAEKAGHKKVIIPGLVSVLSGSIKEESGWDVIVGPREASGLVSFLKANWRS